MEKKYGNPELHYVASFSYGWLFLRDCFVVYKGLLLSI
jgi:hypothetical protein